MYLNEFIQKPAKEHQARQAREALTLGNDLRHPDLLDDFRSPGTRGRPLEPWEPVLDGADLVEGMLGFELEPPVRSRFRWSTGPPPTTKPIEKCKGQSPPSFPLGFA